MNANVEKIMLEALQQPKAIRAMIVETLIDSLDEDQTFELSPEWQTEVEKRCQEIDQGFVELLDAETVLKNAYKAC